MRALRFPTARVPHTFRAAFLRLLARANEIRQCCKIPCGAQACRSIKVGVKFIIYKHRKTIAAWGERGS